MIKKEGSEDDSGIGREKEMYLASIAQSFEDVTVKWGKKHAGEHYRPTDDEIKKSLLFLTSTSGPWHESRVTICDVCGLDADYVRRKAIRAIESGTEYRKSDYSSDYEVDYEKTSNQE